MKQELEKLEDIIRKANLPHEISVAKGEFLPQLDFRLLLHLLLFYKNILLSTYHRRHQSILRIKDVLLVGQ